jgi:hypothetical protein
MEKELSAPEILVLLEPNIAAQEALKAGFKELIARRLLHLETTPPKSKWESEQVHLLFNSGNHPQNPVLRSLWGDLRSASRHGSGLNQVLQRLQREYGLGYETFKQKIVLPSLLQRGLLQKQTHKALRLFPQTRYLPTPDGTALKKQLEQHMSEARRLIPSLADGKAEASALLLSLGPALLLLPGLESHFQHLGAHLRTQGAEGGFTPIFVVPDAEEQETLERAFHQFDAALAGAGDGGSDGGGGGE